MPAWPGQLRRGWSPGYRGPFSVEEKAEWEWVVPAPRPSPPACGQGIHPLDTGDETVCPPQLVFRFDVKGHARLKGPCEPVQVARPRSLSPGQHCFYGDLYGAPLARAVGESQLDGVENGAFSKLEAVSEKVPVLPSEDVFLPALRNGALSPGSAATECPSGGRTVVRWLSGGDPCR